MLVKMHMIAVQVRPQIAREAVEINAWNPKVTHDAVGKGQYVVEMLEGARTDTPICRSRTP